MKPGKPIHIGGGSNLRNPIGGSPRRSLEASKSSKENIEEN